MANTNYATPVAISDPHLKRALLQHLIEQEDVALPVELAGFLAEIRERSLQDFLALTSARTLRISVSIGNLRPGLRQLDASNRQADLLSYFVQHGASRSMLCEYFSLTPTTARAMRVEAGIHHTGRAQLPPPEIRDRIHATWHQMQQELPSTTSQRERVYALHRQFEGVSIRVLEAVLKESGFTDHPL